VRKSKRDFEQGEQCSGGNITVGKSQITTLKKFKEEEG